MLELVFSHQCGLKCVILLNLLGTSSLLASQNMMKGMLTGVHSAALHNMHYIHVCDVHPSVQPPDVAWSVCTVDVLTAG